MKKLLIIGALIGFILSGIIFFAWVHEWIVIYFPKTAPSQFTQPAVRHKSVTYCFPLSKEQKRETARLVWLDDEAENLTYLLKGWCALMHEEGVVGSPVNVQRVLLADGYAYLSFDQPLFEQEPTREKIALLRALVSTIVENSSSVTHIVFLINHHPWHDAYLDFSSPWPIACFS